MKSVDIMKCKLVKDSSLEYSAVKTSETAAEIFKAFGLTDAADEIFCILCLASDGSITGIHEISHGDLSSSLVHPREVFKRAILNNAARIILGHNHPSGNLKASNEDLKITERLSKAGNLLGIEVVDHLIITENGHTSFLAEGLL